MVKYAESGWKNTCELNGWDYEPNTNETIEKARAVLAKVSP